MKPDDSENVTKGGRLLAIPGRLSDRHLPIRVQCLPKECDEAVEAKEQRSGALNGQIRPLSLGLQAYMRVAFLEGRFQTPACA